MRQTLTVASTVDEGRVAFRRQACAEAYELLAGAGRTPEAERAQSVQGFHERLHALSSKPLGQLRPVEHGWDAARLGGDTADPMVGRPLTTLTRRTVSTAGQVTIT